MNIEQVDDLLRGGFKELSVSYEPELGILWYYVHPQPRPCFTPRLLREIADLQRRVGQDFDEKRGPRKDFRYLVGASRSPGVFSLGGDLELFLRLIRERDRDGLTEYARACIDICYANFVALNLPITTISLVEGDAMGGGFEAALSSDVLIAEHGVRMGFPEILFNLFPGMGAYSFLSRRIDKARAERMILSGTSYPAEELYEMGLVDVLARKGEGRQAVYDYVRRQKRCWNGTRAVHRVRRRLDPITYEELLDVTLMWVDTALDLRERDLAVVERLVRMQNRFGSRSAERKESVA